VSEASVVVLDQPIGVVSPRLYGHFAEHLGRCCYDGLWAGDGFRADVVEALRELGTPLIRWPGGCYADHYHWRNGIGAPATRPRTLGTSCGTRVADHHALGTHEFLGLCEELATEPYLALNVGSGTVQEACDWVEYVNGTAPTDLVRERAANGRPEPWGVRLWGIGNESWDCGGRFDPASYAAEYLRYATMIRHVDPTAELVAVGMEDDGMPLFGMDPQWNEKLLAALGSGIALVDHLSVHRYWVRGGPETGFDEEDYYTLLEEAAGTEALIERTAALLARATGSGRAVGIALDEWGVWHPEARDWGPGEVPRRTPATFEQACTMRDALAAAIALEGFHRQCRVLSMANLAQVVNVLQAILLTDGSACVRTPTYHAFALHRPHMGAEALRVEAQSDTAGPTGRPAITATASSRGSSTAVTILNRDYRRPLPVTIRVAGRVTASTVVAADSPDAVNSPAQPDRVAPRPLAVDDRGHGSFSVTMPPCSIATIEFAGRAAEGH
jgi:alpha-N-arabinofuranosidase